MTSIEKALDLFFKEECNVYYNPFKVEVAWLHGNGVCAVTKWPGFRPGKHIVLELVYESDDYASFINAFNLHDNIRYEIDNITPGTLLTLYMEGLGEVSCIFDGIYGYNMNFRRYGNLVLAQGDNVKEHPVPEKPEQPEQFIEYSRKFCDL